MTSPVAPQNASARCWTPEWFRGIATAAVWWTLASVVVVVQFAWRAMSSGPREAVRQSAAVIGCFFQDLRRHGVELVFEQGGVTLRRSETDQTVHSVASRLDAIERLLSPSPEATTGEAAQVAAARNGIEVARERIMAILTEAARQEQIQSYMQRQCVTEAEARRALDLSGALIGAPPPPQRPPRRGRSIASVPPAGEQPRQTAATAPTAAQLNGFAVVYGADPTEGEAMFEIRRFDDPPEDGVAALAFRRNVFRSIILFERHIEAVASSNAIARIARRPVLVVNMQTWCPGARVERNVETTPVLACTLPAAQ